MQSSKSLKTQLVAAAVSVVLSAFALSAATYAWYVANTKVSATTSTISATTNGFILQIDELKNGAQHGGEQKSLEAQTMGATLSPSSTDDLKNWYVCNGWDNQGLVTDYSTPNFSTTAKALPGEYEVAGKKYNAFIKSDYIVYTITDTGTADVYLDASDGAPVTIEPVGGEASETMVGSLRVAITTQAIGDNGKSGTGPEDLRVVYAMSDEKGKGNDATAIAGWTSIQNIDGKPTLAQATYRHIYTGGTDGWVATKGTSGDYSVAADTNPIATGVGYKGIPFTSTFGWKEPTRIALTANPSRTARRPITSASSSPVSQRHNANVCLNTASPRAHFGGSGPFFVRCHCCVGDNVENCSSWRFLMDGIASSVPLIARPSYDRACSLVPTEYVLAWEWFLREEQRGEIWEKLPHNIKADSPQYPYRMMIGSETFCVSRQSGIYWPGRGHIKHPVEKTFALSVHSSTSGSYSDVPPLYLEDGTWVFKYSSQSASVESWRDQRYNEKMINCMECGVPVGVFFATSAGYKVLGLAFVERYEPENSWFVLHGPVHKGGPDARFYPDMSYMKDDPIAAEFSGASASDEEKVRYALRRERIGQQRFRTQLFEAYTGKCAVSGCNVSEALEAAHIENYSGPKSQVVSNGILLRRDLHSLFDAHLISFELVRGDYQLCGSYLLEHTDYATFAGSVLREPDEHRLRPNARFLEAHRAEFAFSESRRRAEAVAPY